MHTKLIPLALVALAIVGCGSPEQNAEMASSADMAPRKSKTSGDTDNAAKGEGASLVSQDLQRATQARVLRRAVIRNAALVIRVDNVEASEKKVAAVVEAAQGYVAGTQSTNLGGEAPSLKMSLKVGADRFDAAINALEELGDRLTKSIQTQDITAQLVDLDARLGIMRDEETALRNLLKAARSQDQMLDVQGRIMNLRAEIESLAAQQRELSGLAALSSIELELTQSTTTAVAASDPNWASETMGSALSALAAVGRTMATMFIWLTLFAPIWVPALILSRIALRSAKRTVS